MAGEIGKDRIVEGVSGTESLVLGVSGVSSESETGEAEAKVGGFEEESGWESWKVTG